MKILFTSFVITLLWQNAFAQSVGINTNSPHPSSILDVNSTSKGVLFPKISLQSATDKFTIPNPANALLLYNTNTQMGTEGFYYNSGDSNNPLWQLLGTKLSFPFSQIGSSNVALFYISNTGSSPNSIAISGSSQVVGVRGASDAGIGVSGTSSSGVGVFASSTSGLALHVFGKLKIAGNGQSPASGKILTSDAAGNATWQFPAVNLIAFSEVGINGGGNINSSGGADYVTVNFGTVAYNLGGAYSAASNSFTAPVSGIYHFDAMVEWTHPNLTFSPTLQLIKNTGSSLVEIALDFKYQAVSKHTSIITIDCQLQQGEVVFVRGKSGTNGIELETSNSTAHFNGRLLQKL
ncbi:complement C1q domain-containing protein [Dyadobacter fanqingshengii]|uniref:Complement C1q domain-containing protein n=1 Tax=Dyadobacter fanqingshengii TaxID=2906443 RepID=A0A9X1T9D5_9BACT|nr:complement C1q domain-containing protein [Dyadobacter fanqingshengii]MCF0039844.1 complement C1q domain-containing protein [Dyadobacter fanqingshengii]USJ38394.1 complement C1q domain-containing protein [Dyadobacter fanqingshengii]